MLLPPAHSWRQSIEPRSKRSAGGGVAGRVELLVIGGGLAGLVCAWRAAEAGAEVLVCDAPGRPAAAEVAAGMIAPVGELSWGEEATLAAAIEASRRWPELRA